MRDNEVGIRSTCARVIPQFYTRWEAEVSTAILILLERREEQEKKRKRRGSWGCSHRKQKRLQLVRSLTATESCDLAVKVE
ncbi:hypothetical protein FRX31_007616 [Thalictrum thalictroides]|uniref:Uncharacterized protein n=1 Tax=Thalictrum thalictroides TaxID=46969 RepID=A0A7J6X162_THATH|nr:hypothetical protein FRX31_007616 [Thalictrum thalictroides]